MNMKLLSVASVLVALTAKLQAQTTSGCPL